MNNFIKHGKSPFNILVVHGGPGAAGSANQFSKELSKDRGIIEALQTRDSIAAQIRELKDVIIAQADTQVVLIGHSWGAWLSVLVAAKYPQLIKKIITIGSGPFEEKYVAELNTLREERFKGSFKNEIKEFNNQLNSAACLNKDEPFTKLGKIISKLDTFCELSFREEKTLYCNFKIFKKIWAEAGYLRSSGKLVKELSKIKCPISAIHGDYDPHPARGVKEALSRYTKNYNFKLLKKCGHYPWKEKYARDEFYTILEKEL